MGAAAVPALLLASLLSGSAGAGHVTVIASGLHNPRGIDVGAKGRVYVAETGAGRIVRVGAGGVTAIESGLPVAELQEGEFSGPVNVAATPSGKVFALVGGGPRDEDARFGTLLRVSGPNKLVADIAAFQESDPDPADQDDFPTESNPYGVAPIGSGRFLVADAAGNDLLLVKGNGKVVNVARLPLHMVSGAGIGVDGLVPAESVPTSVAVGPDGYWYVSELTGFPFTPDASRIWRIAPWARGAVCDGDTRDGCSLYLDGFTAVTGIEFGPDGSLYVVEMVRNGLLALFGGGDTTGALIRVEGGARTEVAAGRLTLPADVAVARNGMVYVTTGSITTEGQVVAITP